MDRREWPILQDPNVARGSCLFWQTRRTEKDISLRFLTLIAQRLSVYPLGRQLFALQTDVCNLAASIAKIQLMHKSRKRDQTRCPSHGRDRSRVHSLPRAPLRPECRESTARAMITELAFCFWPTAKDARQGILCSITFDVRIHTHTALCFAARPHMAEARTRDEWKQSDLARRPDSHVQTPDVAANPRTGRVRRARQKRSRKPRRRRPSMRPRTTLLGVTFASSLHSFGM